MPVSSEFISLCRSQIALLTQGLGAALSVVYLTERLVEEETAKDKLIPVVAYPEDAGMWKGSQVAGALIPAASDSNNLPLLRSENTVLPSLDLLPEAVAYEGQPDEPNRSLVANQQIVLPLIHEGVLMGLLVTSREDRAWNEQERY